MSLLAFPPCATVLRKFLLLLPIFLLGCMPQDKQTPPLACSFEEPEETDGHRRLALIVGVGEYENSKITRLDGAPEDAHRIYALLTGKDGYGFPEKNVCMLLNEQATTANFQDAFERTLIQRARPGDVAVFYYSGHGSQIADRNGDEPDEWDETFMFHDARSGGVRDFSDDAFNGLLARLHEKTRNITVILDSCNSGTATRGGDDTYIARFQPPSDGEESAVLEEGIGDSSGQWLPETLPGTVIFTAAGDGTPALERGKRGVFTDALLEALGQVGDRPLTYAQAARQITPLVSARSYQIPYFHGDLNTVVFGNTGRTRPLGWDVTKVRGNIIEFTGSPLPGIGEGAELRVYDGGVTGADTRDPRKAKAMVVIDSITGINATGHIDAALSEQPLERGDLAVLARPADDTLKISVHLRSSGKYGVIPGTRAKNLREDIENHPEANMLVSFTEDAGDFELSLDKSNRLVLRGPEHRVRMIFDRDRAVPENLWQHARQRALLQLRGEGGADFKDNETLQVRIVEAKTSNQNKCARGTWVQSEPNQEQVIPLCHAWQIEVELDEKSPKPLLVGALVLSNDGSVFGIPEDGYKEPLKPGEKVIFADILLGSPPLDVLDHVLVFGTQESNPVQWNLLADTAKTRSGKGKPTTGLYRVLDRYLRPGTRGAQRLKTVDTTTWTMTALSTRVEANSRFVTPDSGTTGKKIDKKEYTIANFNIRPYLPGNPDAALYKVLQKADWLYRYAADRYVTTGGIDGVPYKQHSWNKPTDEENLKVGIDCSRAIWFVFTRTGLPYNRSEKYQGKGYLSTAVMVGAKSRMNDEFDSCMGDPKLKIGDVLVYRDAKRGDGHTVMVIDPKKRIAWGSHGWDGNEKLLGIKEDTGIEYQRIRIKKDWERWDRSTMKRVACWRYRRFTEEADTLGQPDKMPVTICDADRNCGS
uniref:Caspase domain-containing protein n=1 Tax=Candidatus Kentrum sp. FW TaxID=2126338 RepID=A0A450T9K5_9GAMM|nr:MAG: Caspase domain-containing protein [Candidatus Kentron sp. FW]